MIEIKTKIKSQIDYCNAVIDRCVRESAEIEERKHNFLQFRSDLSDLLRIVEKKEREANVRATEKKANSLLGM